MIVSYCTALGSHRGGLIRPRSVSRCSVLMTAASSGIRPNRSEDRTLQIVYGFTVIDQDGALP